jgi:hypothetical protein
LFSCIEFVVRKIVLYDWVKSVCYFNLILQFSQSTNYKFASRKPVTSVLVVRLQLAMSCIFRKMEHHQITSQFSLEVII